MAAAKPIKSLHNFSKSSNSVELSSSVSAKDIPKYLSINTVQMFGSVRRSSELEKSKKHNFAKSTKSRTNLLSSIAGSLAAVTVCHPLEVIKIRLQIQVIPKSSK